MPRSSLVDRLPRATSRLQLCHELWGGAEIRSADPLVGMAEDVIFTPHVHQGRWGVFDREGRPVPGTVDYRDIADLLINQQPVLDATVEDAAWAPDDDYIYGGRYNNHYGHFLIETLPRLWPLAEAGLGGRKIAMHGHGPAEHWFSLPFAKPLFNALGLVPGDVVNFAAPTRIRRLSVPHPSLQQQKFGHPAFARLMRRIGATLLADADLTRNDRPVYLSKARMTAGVQAVENESAIEQTLEAGGVEILHPEGLDMFQQVRLLATRTTVLGIAGSAFHTAIFSAPVGRHLILNPIPQLNANYRLFDLLNGNDASYYFPAGTEVVEGDGRFLTVRTMPEPEEIARDLLRLI